MLDLDRPDIYTLPEREFVAYLKGQTNLRVVTDDAHPKGHVKAIGDTTRVGVGSAPGPDDPDDYVVRAGSFPGWETVPTW